MRIICTRSCSLRAKSASLVPKSRDAIRTSTPPKNDSARKKNPSRTETPNNLEVWRVTVFLRNFRFERVEYLAYPSPDLDTMNLPTEQVPLRSRGSDGALFARLTRPACCRARDFSAGPPAFLLRLLFWRSLLPCIEHARKLGAGA